MDQSSRGATKKLKPCETFHLKFWWLLPMFDPTVPKGPFRYDALLVNKLGSLVSEATSKRISVARGTPPASCGAVVFCISRVEKHRGNV